MNSDIMPTPLKGGSEVMPTYRCKNPLTIEE
jgi:hypothetical protein